MATFGDGLKNIFLAGLGAMAYTGEKGKEIVEQLVDKGEITLDQGRELNEELKRKASDATKDVRVAGLEAAMMAMSVAEREEFAAKAAEIAKKQNDAAAAKAKEKSDAEEAETVEAVVEEVIVETEEKADEVAEAVVEAVEADGE